MASRFQVEDLVSQTADSVVYRVVDSGGEAWELTRLRLDDEAVESLAEPGIFKSAVSALREIKHANLKEVEEVGSDEVDGYPWLTGRWLEGQSLSECEIGEKEMRDLGEQIQSLVGDLGDQANSVNFDARQILTARDDEGKLHALFSIDYLRWFKDWAAGYPPGAGRNAAAEVRNLLEGLAAKQLKMPRKVSEQVPIPFVEERSPVLASYDLPRDPIAGRVLTWLGMLLAVGVILFFTVKGMERLNENPRDEVPVMSRPGR